MSINHDHDVHINHFIEIPFHLFQVSLIATKDDHINQFDFTGITPRTTYNGADSKSNKDTVCAFVDR